MALWSAASAKEFGSRSRAGESWFMTYATLDGYADAEDMQGASHPALEHGGPLREAMGAGNWQAVRSLIREQGLRPGHTMEKCAFHNSQVFRRCGTTLLHMVVRYDRTPQHPGVDVLRDEWGVEGLRQMAMTADAELSLPLHVSAECNNVTILPALLEVTPPDLIGVALTNQQLSK